MFLFYYNCYNFCGIIYIGFFRCGGVDSVLYSKFLWNYSYVFKFYNSYFGGLLRKILM